MWRARPRLVEYVCESAGACAQCVFAKLSGNPGKRARGKVTQALKEADDVRPRVVICACGGQVSE